MINMLYVHLICVHYILLSIYYSTYSNRKVVLYSRAENCCALLDSIDYYYHMSLNRNTRPANNEVEGA